MLQLIVLELLVKGFGKRLKDLNELIKKEGEKNSYFESELALCYKMACVLLLGSWFEMMKLNTLLDKKNKQNVDRL